MTDRKSATWSGKIKVVVIAPTVPVTALACLDASRRPCHIAMVNGVALVPPGYTVLGTV